MFSKSISTTTLLALFVGSTMFSSSASAQSIDSSVVQSAVVVSTPVDIATVAGAPRIAPSGVTKSMQATPVVITATNAMASGENVGRDKAMMGVGLAAVVVGLIIGSDIGTLFVVGGALVGLVGLFRYMQ